MISECLYGGFRGFMRISQSLGLERDLPILGWLEEITKMNETGSQWRHRELNCQ